MPADEETRLRAPSIRKASLNAKGFNFNTMDNISEEANPPADPYFNDNREEEFETMLQVPIMKK